MCEVMASAPDDGFLSRMTVERSARDVYRAHVQPAGPPPTMATSASMICMWSEEGAWCGLDVGVNAEVWWWRSNDSCHATEVVDALINLIIVAGNRLPKRA